MIQATHLRQLITRTILGTTLAAGALGVTMMPHEAGAQATAAITISGFAFHASTLTIAPGTTVTWTNQDSAAHTATSDTNSAVPWDSGMLATGKSFSFTFSKSGTFTYHCSYHANMHATIIVTSASIKKVIKATAVNNHYVFSAKKTTIHVGTKVVWTNTTSAAHTVTSTSSNWKFDKQLAPGTSLSHIFKKAGKYTYLCKYHPGMVGTIIVKA